MSTSADGDQLVSEDCKDNKPVRKRRRVYGDKFCEVCGDKALAHHFGILACETCKAFFRRNAFVKDSRKCLFEGNCPVNVKTRRFCPACRLAKCFSVGMRADLILDEDEKKERMQKVNEKRSKREQQEKPGEEAHRPQGETLHSPPCNVTTTDTDPVPSPEMSGVLEQAWHSASELFLQEVGSVKSPGTQASPGTHASHSVHSAATHASHSVHSAATHASPATHASHSVHSAATHASPATHSSSDGRWSHTPLPHQASTSFEVLYHSTNLALGQDSKTAVFSQQQQQHSENAGYAVPPVEFYSPLTPTTSHATTPGSSTYSGDSWQQTPLTPPTVVTQTRTENHHSADTAALSSVQQQQQQQSMAISASFLDFEHVSRDNLPSDPYMYWRLSEEERCLLTQLSAAYQDTLLAVLKGSPPRDFMKKEQVTSEFYLQECEDECRLVVSFAKRMEDFRQLRQDEQIALLKASSCQVLGIRGCALYIAEKNAWLTRLGYFTVDHCEMICPNHPLQDPSLQFCRTIKSIVKNDVTLYALLHCLVLFDPCDDKVIDRQLINSIRDKYVILLRHYLESVYSYRYSEKYMLALQENLIFYRNLCQEGKPLIKKFFPTIPSKLLVELLDLE